MTNQFKRYRQHAFAAPSAVLAWNMYGSGIENIGKDGHPETLPVELPDEDHMLVRVDSVGMCFSDVKLIRLGSGHPKLYNRDLTQEPTRLGHEASVTVVAVGANLQDKYPVGQRLAVQPDIYQNGKSTAYGYTIPGGLIQYHLIGKEMLETDAGPCLLPLANDQMGYAESALLEPWGCVFASYTQRRRLTPKAGGVMLIIGSGSQDRELEFSDYLDQPATIVLSNVSDQLAALVKESAPQAEIIVKDNLQADQYANLSAEMTDGKGFDDIVAINFESAANVTQLATHIARRGTLNLIAQQPLDGMVDADVGRLHYDYIAFIGTNTTNIAASYGEARNRCELREGGVAVFMGAGGPMGQMHVQRAIEHPQGPKVLIATEVNDMRLDAVAQRFGQLAEENGCKLITCNPMSTEGPSLADIVSQETDGRGADDVVVCVSVAPLMAEGGSLMAPDGMLVLFAGVPNGTLAPLNVSDVYLHNAQFTGTSGLTIDDQADVMNKTLAGELSPGRSVAAIGGMNAAIEGITAMMNGSFPGKVVIFPQIPDLPLLGLPELHEHYPEIAKHLGAGDSWTNAAEEALIDAMWPSPAAD